MVVVVVFHGLFRGRLIVWPEMTPRKRVSFLIKQLARLDLIIQCAREEEEKEGEGESLRTETPCVAQVL